MVVCLRAEESSAEIQGQLMSQDGAGGVRVSARKASSRALGCGRGSVVGALWCTSLRGEEGASGKRGSQSRPLQHPELLACVPAAISSRAMSKSPMVACATPRRSMLPLTIRCPICRRSKATTRRSNTGRISPARREEGLRLNGPVGRLDRGEESRQRLEHRGHRAGHRRLAARAAPLATAYEARGQRSHVQFGNSPVGRIS